MRIPLALIALSLAVVAITLLTLPNCPTEDSSNCIWRAESAGNGQGRSFINLFDQVFYL